MSALYLETSALLAWLFGEPGGEEIEARIDGAEAVVFSALTLTESARAIARAESEGALSGGDARRLHGVLRRTVRCWTRMSLSDDVLERAGRPFPVEPLRTLDALHLATALEFAELFDGLAVLSHDRRILDNAEALGLL